MDKERLDKLERKMQSSNSVPVKDVRIDSGDLRSLIDERHELLEALDAVISGNDWNYEKARAAIAKARGETNA